MDDKENIASQEQLKFKRVAQFMEKLADRAIPQQEIADRTGMSRQWISDVRNGRRKVTELFARRLVEEFGAQVPVSYAWLMGETPKTSGGPVVNPSLPTENDRLMLPIVSSPIQGSPLKNPKWNGSFVEVVGAAAVSAFHATDPYVLKFNAEDRLGRLAKNDLLLMSQDVSETASIVVIKDEKKFWLVRRNPEGGWERVARNAEEVSKSARPVGHCLGIIWAPL